jgi:hypothetical protein
MLTKCTISKFAFNAGFSSNHLKISINLKIVCVNGRNTLRNTLLPEVLEARRCFGSDRINTWVKSG